VNYNFTQFYNERLCVAVTYVLRTGIKAADVDNMAKPLLDALQDYAYENDRQIDHLDTVRLNSGSGDEAYIGVRIALTRIAKNCARTFSVMMAASLAVMTEAYGKAPPAGFRRGLGVRGGGLVVSLP
jgi:hypothetical protein